METVWPSNVKLRRLSCALLSVFNRRCMSAFFTGFPSPDSLYVTSLSDSDFHKAIRRLRPSKFLVLYGIPAFSINDYSDVLMPVLKCTFNFSLSQHISPTLWKQAAFVAISKQGKTALDSNYTPISIFQTFSKIFEIIIHITFHAILLLDCNKCPLNGSLFGFNR